MLRPRPTPRVSYVAAGTVVALVGLIGHAAIAAPPPQGPSKDVGGDKSETAASSPSAGGETPPNRLGEMGTLKIRADARGDVTLPQLLEHARDHAPAILVAQGRLSIGDADLEAARPLLVADPELYVYLGPRFSQGRTSLDIQSAISQPVEIALERRLRIETAKRLQDYTQRDLDRVTWELEVEIRLNFHMALLARFTADTASQVRTFNERILEIVLIQLREGDIAPLQVKIAEVQAAQAQQAEIAALNHYYAATRRLAALTGWEEPSLEPRGSLPAPEEVPPGTDLSTLAAANQPRLKTLQAAVDHGEASLRLAKRNTVPEPSFGIYYGRERDAFANINWNIVLGTITMRIPAWQRNRREKAYAKSNIAVVKSERDAFALALPPLTAAAAAAVDAAAKQIDLYEASIFPSLQSNLELLNKGYELGEIDVLQVSLARERFFAIQTGLVQGYRDYVSARADLERILGADAFSADAQP